MNSRTRFRNAVYKIKGPILVISCLFVSGFVTYIASLGDLDFLLNIRMSHSKSCLINFLALLYSFEATLNSLNIDSVTCEHHHSRDLADS